MVASARSAHVTLPAEMIEAIIQHVDWRTLLYVRLVSPFYFDSLNCINLTARSPVVR